MFSSHHHLKHHHHPMMAGFLPSASSVVLPTQNASPAPPAHSAVKNAKLPPFLKKLVDLTNSCPPHIGGWNEDGTQFIVRSSQFADLLREQFNGSLQTFVRQLHFYSFNKKDDGARGIWTFSHPYFVRGQPHLLVNIERKSNPKKKGGREDSDDEGGPVQRESSSSTAPSSTSSLDKATITALEKRLTQMESKMERVTSLEKEVSDLKHELVALKDFAAAQNLLSLAPSSDTKKRVKEDPLKSMDDHISKSEKDEALMNLAPPKKVTRLISTDSVLGELRDFPFEDTSSVGSVSVREMLRELQNDIFNNEFDDFIPVPSKFSSMQATPSSTNSPVENAEGGELCKNECFNIPNGFELQPGVTMSLLKQVYCVTRKICCPNNKWAENHTTDKLKQLVDDLVPPANMLPVEMCPITRELLPILRENVEEEASDLALMKAARQVYEVYYQTVQKKMQEMGQRPSSCSATPKDSQTPSSQ